MSTSFLEKNIKIATDPLIVLDKYCAYIPVVSTIETIVNFIALIIIINSESICSKTFKDRTNRTYTYNVHIVQTKDWLRLVLMFIPVVGNIILAIMDTPPKEVRQIQECVEKGNVEQALVLCEVAMDAGYGREYVDVFKTDVVSYYQEQIMLRGDLEDLRKGLYVCGPYTGTISGALIRGSYGKYGRQYFGTDEYTACMSMDRGRGEVTTWRHHAQYGKRMKSLEEFLKMCEAYGILDR